MNRKIPGILAGFLVCLWPFIYLFPYAFQIGGRYLKIGNDFPLFYNYKVYLLDLLSHFHIPLWSPSEAGGYPFYSSPFPQTFYPLNIPLAFFYRTAGGYTDLDHQRFTILGISIFALGCFLWLRSLNIKLTSALFSSLIISASYKITELIRFPHAVHTMCWYPWILYAITKLLCSTNKKQKVVYGGLLFFSGFCMITGGYVY